jgi:hypothetical protein
MSEISFGLANNRGRFSIAGSASSSQPIGSSTPPNSRNCSPTAGLPKCCNRRLAACRPLQPTDQRDDTDDPARPHSVQRNRRAQSITPIPEAVVRDMA